MSHVQHISLEAGDSCCYIFYFFSRSGGILECSFALSGLGVAIVSECTLVNLAGHVPDTDKEAIFESWAAHFNSMPNRLSNINENGIDRLPQIEC